MDIKPKVGSAFPDLDLLDQKEKQKKYEEEISQLSEIEQKKFNYISLTQHNDFSQRKMYWSSALEKMGRSLIIFSQLFAIVLAYFFAEKIIVNSLRLIVNLDNKLVGNIKLQTLIDIIFITLSVVFAIIFTLPMLLCRTAGSVYGWAVAYIILAIAYFLFIAILSAIFIIVASVKFGANVDQNGEMWLIIVIVLALVITIIWITGACFLIVKSDDVKRKISLEV